MKIEPSRAAVIGDMRDVDEMLAIERTIGGISRKVQTKSQLASFRSLLKCLVAGLIPKGLADGRRRFVAPASFVVDLVKDPSSRNINARAALASYELAGQSTYQGGQANSMLCPSRFLYSALAFPPE